MVVQERFADAVGAIAAAVRAGSSLDQAIRYAAGEAEPPIRRTARRPRCRTRSRASRSIVAIDGWARELGTDDGDLVAGALDLHRRSGGDLPAVLDQVTATIRDRVGIAREVRSLTAQARLSAWILGLLPVGFFAFLWLTARDEIEGALRTPDRHHLHRRGARGSKAVRSCGSDRCWWSNERPRAGGTACRGRRVDGGGARVCGQAAGIPSPSDEHPRTRPASSPRRARTRGAARNAHREVPQLLDLLAAGSTAGLSAELSFRRAVACLRGSLARALGDVVHADRPRHAVAAGVRRLRGRRRAIRDLRRDRGGARPDGDPGGSRSARRPASLRARSARRGVPKRSNGRGRRP